MQAIPNTEHTATASRLNSVAHDNIEKAIAQSWSRIAPFWPLKNLIAVNPLQGFEGMSFKDALRCGQAYFQQSDLPAAMENVNRETIKWLQAFFDNGQASIKMPNREDGLLKAVKNLLRFDKKVIGNDHHKKEWLEHLPDDAHRIIAECLLYLGINSEEQATFLTLMLTTLSGWAGHVQYRTNWSDAEDAARAFTVTQAEYSALRLILTCLMWPQAKELLDWFAKATVDADASNHHIAIEKAENQYHSMLLSQLAHQEKPTAASAKDAQLVFCIDVRSEPFRRAVEAQGNYETLGFAGFFGVPIAVEDTVTEESYASCPVLLQPAQTVKQAPVSVCDHDHHHHHDHDHHDHSHHHDHHHDHHDHHHHDSHHHQPRKGYLRLQAIKRLYQAVKYNFTTPFPLVETIGIGNGVWMALKTLAPRFSNLLKNKIIHQIQPHYKTQPLIDSIALDQQIEYGAGALKLMGLTKNFAPLVVFCGHGSETENNAYATSLDCGACGGRHGAPNAKVLAAILNNEDVRHALKADHDIVIPAETLFVAAQHNTTTDAVEIFDQQFNKAQQTRLNDLQEDLDNAKRENAMWRASNMIGNVSSDHAVKKTMSRAQDWAQTRPEWGLARNAAFIVGPRWLSDNIALEGRSFLHSYDYSQDKDGTALTTILTAPMVVTQWINTQYLFSTYDNIAFGGGSKITKNITGKIGIMQGNASDIMHGLSLQSVFKNDDEAYHEPMRLMTIVYASRKQIDSIIKAQDILQKLFGNGWIKLSCIEPETGAIYQLQEDLTWDQYIN